MDLRLCARRGSPIPNPCLARGQDLQVASVGDHRPRVGVIILQWRRAGETVACLRSLERLEYPDYEVIVIDNHSGDGSVERLRAEIPGATIHESPE